MAFSSARDAETGIDCPDCGHKLRIGRDCFTVFIHCPSCGKKFPLKNMLNKGDEAMEKFLENVYIDRI